MIQAAFKIKGGKEYGVGDDVTGNHEANIRRLLSQPLPVGVSKGDVIREIKAWAASTDHKGEFSWKDLTARVTQHVGQQASASASTSVLPSTSLPTPKQNPWISPKSKNTKAMSPGGTIYRQRSPYGKYEEKSRREAAGYQNPSHSHGNMLPHWQKSAQSPLPSKAKKSQQEMRKHFMDPKRRFEGTSPGKTRTTVFQGHQRGVLGHEPSASTHWNQGGHKQDRSAILAHNRQTKAYHGIEYRPWSDASGSKEPRYESPGPHKGSHPSHWKRSDPKFKGGPWHSWEEDK